MKHLKLFENFGNIDSICKLMRIMMMEVLTQVLKSIYLALGF